MGPLPTKSYKMVLLEAFQELDGWHSPAALDRLAERSWQVLQRRRSLLGDLPDAMRAGGDAPPSDWLRYWRATRSMPGHAVPKTAKAWFRINQAMLTPSSMFKPRSADPLPSSRKSTYRLAAYEVRKSASSELPDNVIPLARPTPGAPSCRTSPTSRSPADTFAAAAPRRPSTGRLARLTVGSTRPATSSPASGQLHERRQEPPSRTATTCWSRSMLEQCRIDHRSIVAIERQDEAGDNQYLLRVVTKTREGAYILKANNPDYEDLAASDEMRARALAERDRSARPNRRRTLHARRDPGLVRQTFNPGNWNAGHVVLEAQHAHILFVTLNKQGKAEDHRYLDHWIDEHSFHWQSQNPDHPEQTRAGLIEHHKRGIALHLFVRDHKLKAGKGRPFRKYCGRLRYASHPAARR